MNNYVDQHYSADPCINMGEYDFGKPISMGTSLIAVEFEGGVVIGADSRTSSGQYIANRVSNKLTRITDYIYCCRAGNAAHTQAVADVVKYNLSLMQFELGEEPSVALAASVFRELGYNYRDSLSAEIICAGWDKRLGGQVYSIPVGGMLVRMPLAISGSGSTFMHGYADSVYKKGMSKDDCVNMIKTALALSMSRDGHSGGVIRVGVITEAGIEKKVFYGEDLQRFEPDYTNMTL